MGKKVKTGKKRKDKFYHLAKEIGYRARSAFKLLQLNRKFQFLQKSRVLIDLCAAPGGWLQVASNHMPVSSLIVGVDLVPIRPIPRTITIQADITTEKCRSLLQKELKDWKADIVLNDGAPNVGKNWIHDAFTQASLTLKALKLASDFLVPGGWFVTKVFRSKDYQPLMWVFKQLFKKVHATKPQASRSESAEIFVICQGYLAPDRIDAKFFDLRHIFKEVTIEPKKITVLKPEKKKKPPAEGYDDGNYTLYHSATVSAFFKTESPLDVLSKASQLILDDDAIAGHKLTTVEILHCCQDIKVLGKRDIKTLLNWRKKILKENEKTEEKKKESESEDIDSEEEIEEQIEKLKQVEKQDAKRKKKQLLVKRRKLRERLALKMDLPNDTLDFGTDESVFSLANIKSIKQLSEVDRGDINFMDDEEEGSEEELKFESSDEEEESDVDDNDEKEDKKEDNHAEWDESEDESEDGSEDEEIPDKEENPLIVHLEDKDTKKTRQTQLWFDKDSFAGVEVDDDEDIEISEMTKQYKKKGGIVLEDSKKSSKSKKVRFDTTMRSDGDEELGDDSDYDEEVVLKSKKQQTKSKQKNKRSFAVEEDGEGFEIVPAVEPAKKVRKLSAEGMAIGALLVSSRKNRRNLIEHGYNRYTFNDDHLPDWFVENEARHSKIQMPVTKEMVAEYRERLKEINARPIKKVAEAKARKKRRMIKRLEKARKKAEVISETIDMSDKEKINHIKTLYKKVEIRNNKKKDVAYVVSKKSLATKRARRPAGVKGPYKVVDKRMKKDVRARLKKEAKMSKRKKK